MSEYSRYIGTEDLDLSYIGLKYSDILGFDDNLDEFGNPIKNRIMLQAQDGHVFSKLILDKHGHLIGWETTISQKFKYLAIPIFGEWSRRPSGDPQNPGWEDVGVSGANVMCYWRESIGGTVGDTTNGHSLSIHKPQKRIDLINAIIESLDKGTNGVDIIDKTITNSNDPYYYIPNPGDYILREANLYTVGGPNWQPASGGWHLLIIYDKSLGDFDVYYEKNGIPTDRFLLSKYNETNNQPQKIQVFNAIGKNTITVRNLSGSAADVFKDLYIQYDFNIGPKYNVISIYDLTEDFRSSGVYLAPKSFVPIITLSPIEGYNYSMSHGNIIMNGTELQIESSVYGGDASSLTSWSITNEGLSENTFRKTVGQEDKSKIWLYPNLPSSNFGTVSIAPHAAQDHESSVSVTLSGQFTEGDVKNVDCSTIVTASYPRATDKSITVKYVGTVQPKNVGTFTWSVINNDSLPDGVSMDIPEQISIYYSTCTITNTNEDPKTINIQLVNSNASNTATLQVTVPGKKHWWYIGSNQPTAICDGNPDWIPSTSDAGFTDYASLSSGYNWLAYPDTWTYSAVELPSRDEFVFNEFVPESIKTSIPGYILVKSPDLSSSVGIEITFSKGTPTNPYYWYLGTTKPTNDAFIESNGTQISNSSEISSFTIDSDEYVYFVYPTSFGTAKIVDEGGDDAGGKAVETLSGVSLTNYKGWRFNKYNSGITYTITFQ